MTIILHCKLSRNHWKITKSRTKLCILVFGLIERRDAYRARTSQIPSQMVAKQPCGHSIEIFFSIRGWTPARLFSILYWKLCLANDHATKKLLVWALTHFLKLFQVDVMCRAVLLVDPLPKIVWVELNECPSSHWHSTMSVGTWPTWTWLPLSSLNISNLLVNCDTKIRKENLSW